MAAKDETVTITRAELAQLVKQAVAEQSAGNVDTVRVAAEAVKQVMGVGAQNATMEERIHAELGTPVPRREPQQTTLIRCHDDRNGFTFTAVVAPSRTHAEGRVVNLIDMKYPADIADRAKGMPYAKVGYMADPTLPGRNGLTVQFLQWRYEQYDKAARSQYVGQSAKYLPRLPGADGEPTPMPLGDVARVYVG